MRHSRVQRVALAGLMAGTALAAVPVQAQTSPVQQAGQVPTTAPAQDQSSAGADSGETLNQGDIIVTAQKRSERLRDVPLAITAVAGDELSRRGIKDPADLVRVVPGFTYQQSAFGTPIYGIRGVSFLDNSAVTVPPVAVYVDQAPLPLSILTPGASLDVERVEVLKGPQGTLFGENATGGAINYIAAKPTSTPQAGGDLTFGRFAEADVSAFVSGPITDTLSVRVSARSEQRGKWQYSATRDQQVGQRDFTVGRVLLDLNPSSSLRFELNVNGWLDRSDSQAPQFQLFVPSTPGAGGYQPANQFYATQGPINANARISDFDPGKSYKHHSNFFQATFRGEYDIAPHLNLTSISFYIKFDGRSPNDNDGSAYPDASGTDINHHDIFTQELRFSGDIGPVRFIVGGFYERDHLNETADSLNEGTNSVILGIHYDGFGILNDQHVSTKAGFGSLDYKLTSNLTLQGAVRYTSTDRSFQGCTFAPIANGQGLAAAFGLLSSVLSQSPTVIPPGGCVTIDQATLKPALLQSSLDEHNTAWRGGISWKPTRNTLLYLSATKGYKGGAYSTIPFVLSGQVSSVKQESVLAYEGGVKTTLLNGHLEIDGSGFHYDYRDKQTTGRVVLPIFGNLPALVNVPKSSVTGGEVAVTVRPVQALRLMGSAIYTDTGIDSDFLSPDPLGAIVNLRGERLPASTKWQAIGDAQYDFPIGRFGGYAGGSVSYHSSSNSQFGNNALFALPAYTLLDLRAGIRGEDDRWTAEVFGRNVTNKYYWTNVALAGDAVARYAAFPVSYGVRLAVRFR